MQSTKKVNCAISNGVYKQKINSNVPSKYKFINVETKNGWVQKRRAQIRNKIVYKSIYPNWLQSAIDKYNNVPKIVSFKPIGDALPYVPPQVSVNTKRWASVDANKWNSDSIFNNLDSIKAKQRERAFKNKSSVKIRDNYLWDVRHVFYNNEKRSIKYKFSKPTDPRSPLIGYLNNKPLYGPLTRGEHQRRLAERRINSVNKYLDNILFGKDLTFHQYCNIISYVNNVKINKIPNINCKNTSIKQIKNKVCKAGIHSSILVDNWFHKRVEVSVAPERSIMLLYKIKSMIKDLRCQRAKINMRFKNRRILRAMEKQPMSNFKDFVQYYASGDTEAPFSLQHTTVDILDACTNVDTLFSFSKYFKNPEPEFVALDSKYWDPVLVDPQMDKDGEGLVTMEQVSDTTLIDQRIPSTEEGPVFTERSWTALTTTEASRGDMGLCDRFLPIANYQWSTNQPNGTLIFDLDLPGDALKKNFETPLGLLFRQHRYWCGDMEIKIEVNSNQLMIGQIQTAFYYGAACDDTWKLRNQYYSCSQMLHTLSQAGSSNPSILNIPYAHIYPYLPISKRKIDCTYLNLGTLRCQVINRLQCTSTSDTKAYIYVFIRFKNNQFLGQVHTSLGYTPPQMLPIATMMAARYAENWLNERSPDANRDLPPMPMVPSPVQILPAGNLSYGTSVSDMVSSLRLDPRGQTPYVGLNRSEMMVSDISRVFGLVQQLGWSMNHPTGKLLGSWFASPVLKRPSYKSVVLSSENYHIIPPVAYISSMYKQWRGTLEYRFDIVCNSMYSGSLLVAYIPGQLDDTTLEIAKCSTYVTFNLQDVRTFTFTTPFITDRVWWNRLYAGGVVNLDYDAPGSVQLFVLNPLSLNAIIPSEIEINVYVRAGLDFELSVPVQPSISSCIYPYYRPDPSSDVRAEKGYFPYYVGVSRYHYGGKYTLLRFSSSNDHLVYFKNVDVNHFYYEYTGLDAPFLREKDKSGNWVPSKNKVKFAVGFQDPGNNYFWLCPVKDEAAAQGWLTSLAAGSANESYLYAYPNDDVDPFFGKENLPWAAHKWPIKHSEPEYELVEPDGERENAGVIVTHGNLPNSSLLSFGEDFRSLSTLLRRYQYYGKYPLTSGDFDKRGIFLVLKPNGMFTFSADNDKVCTRSREGVAGLIGACYRFFRGGVRVKLTLSGSVSNPGIVYIQHRPDYSINTEYNNFKLIGQGYATHLFNPNLNPVFSIEVPFYLDSVYGFLGSPRVSNSDDINRNSHLGLISINFEYTQSLASTLRMFTALADDAKFEIMQGVPPVKFLDEERLKDASPSVNLLCDICTGKRVGWDNMIKGCCDGKTSTGNKCECNGVNCKAIICSNAVLECCGGPTVRSKACFSCANEVTQLACPLNESGKETQCDCKRSIYISQNCKVSSGRLCNRPANSICCPNATHSVVVDGQHDTDAEGSLTTKFKKVDTAVEGVIENNSKISKFLDGINGMYDKIFGESSYLRSLCSVDRFILIISQFLHMLVNPHWKTIALGLASIVLSIVNGTAESIIRLSKSIMEYLSHIWEDEQTGPKVNPEGCDAPTGTELVGCLTAVICGAIGYKKSLPGFFLNNMRRLFWDFNIFSRGLDGMIKLLDHLLNCTVRLIKFVFMYKNDVPNVHSLLRNQGKKMVDWALKCEMLLDPRKVVESEMDDTFVEQVVSAHIDGCIFGAQLASCHGESQANMYVKSLTDRLRELCQRLDKQGRNPFTRMVPCSIWINGDPGLGKSTAVTQMAKKMLETINWQEKKLPIYKLEPLNDHWDTCQNQPIFVVDDAFCINSPNALEKQLAAYFCLITNAPFTPPMAHLENKHMRVSPLALISCANVAYPKHACMVEPKALYRRRHVMYEFKLKAAYAARKDFYYGNNVHPEVLTQEERDECAWLSICQYLHPDDEGKSDQKGPYMSYKQFLEDVCSKFKHHYETEQLALRNRINDMLDLCLRDVNPVDSVEELRKPLYDRVKEFCKQKWEEIEKFVIGNETSWKRAYPNSKSLGTSLLPKTPEITVPELDIDITALESQEFQNYVICYLKNRNRILTRQEAGCELSLPSDVLSRYKDFFSQSLGVTPDAVKWDPLRADLGANITIPDDIVHKLVAKFHGQALTSRANEEIDEFVKQWQDTQKLAVTHKCKHNVCACYSLVCVNEVDFAIPTCQVCLVNKALPVRLDPCDKHCLLYNCTVYPTKWIASKIYHYASCLSLLVTNIVCKSFNFIYDHAKTLVKKICTGTTWGLKKVCNIFIKFVLPAIGIYFLGSSIYNYAPSRVKIATAIGTAGGYATGKVLKGYANMMEVFDSLGRRYLVPQGALYEGSANTRGSGKLPIKDLTLRRLANAEGVEDVLRSNENGYLNDAYRIISNNVYTMCVEYNLDDKDMFNSTRGVFIRGRQFLIVKHCWDEICERVMYKSGKLFLLKAPSFNVELDFTKIRVDEFKYSNYVLLTMPNIIPEHKKIIGFIPTYRQHQQITNRGNLLTINTERHSRSVHMQFVNDPITVRNTPNSDAVTMVGCYSYDFGGPGYCGSLLFCTDTNPCLIGMHVAGKDKIVGYSEPLIREMFDDVPNYSSDIVDVVLPSLSDIEESEHEIDGRFLQLGKVDPEFAHHESGKTAIVPSLTHGIFPVLTEPNPLSKNDPRLPPGTSPMRMGVAKHGQPILGFPKYLLDFAYDSLVSELRVNVKPVIGVSPLGLQEAVCGRPGISGFSPLNFNTSEGFPLAAYRPPNFSNKKWLFDLELSQEGYILKGLDIKLRDILVFKQHLREKGILPFTVFTDCLKDTRIAKEKCSIPGKTRVFSISPVDFSIQFRQYFLPYTVAHQNARSKFCTAVGINVNGQEWTDLVLRMVNHSPHQLCGDYSNFGAGFDVDVHHLVHKAILDWFSFWGDDNKVNNRVRSVLLRELLHSYHLCWDIIYQVVCGMPSGSPITVETNDDVNFCYILMAWHEIMRLTGYGSLYYFKKFVIIKTYGDDLWLSVSPIVISNFNNVSIKAFFDKYRVVYTDADKSGEIVPFKDIYNVSFLKRAPIVHPFRPHTYLACLDLKPCLDIANWCWKSSDLVASTLVNLEACSDSLFGRGPEEHEHFRQILQKAAHRLGRIGNFRSWNELDYIFFGEKGDLM